MQQVIALGSHYGFVAACKEVKASLCESLPLNSLSTIAFLHHGFTPGRFVDEREAANCSGRGGGDPLPAQSGPPAQRHQAEECTGRFRQPLQELVCTH